MLIQFTQAVGNGKLVYVSDQHVSEVMETVKGTLIVFDGGSVVVVDALEAVVGAINAHLPTVLLAQAQGPA